MEKPLNEIAKELKGIKRELHRMNSTLEHFSNTDVEQLAFEVNHRIQEQIQELS